MQWDPSQYLQFEEERTRAVRELVARLQLHLPTPGPRRIVDLGCGPANSTAVLAAAWPQAEITGLDGDAAMLAAARQAHPNLRFESDDISAWAAAASRRYDLVFSNSALQWLDDHAYLLPRLMAQVAPGGTLAFQVPGSWDAPVCAIPRALAQSPAWLPLLDAGKIRHWHSESLAFYHDVLAPHPARLDLWECEYVMILPNAEAILAWYQGSGLRPFLAALPDDASRARFQQQYLAALRLAYPPQPNGQILFPFRRRFVIALALS